MQPESRKLVSDTAMVPFFSWDRAIVLQTPLLFSFVFPTFGPDGALLPAGTYGPFDGLFAMRLLFLILFVVALIAWNLQRKLEESKDWTEKQGAAGPRDTFIQMMRRAPPRRLRWTPTRGRS